MSIWYQKKNLNQTNGPRYVKPVISPHLIAQGAKKQNAIFSFVFFFVKGLALEQPQDDFENGRKFVW